MTRLPPYADNALGRALIAEIIANPPESRLIRDDWGARDTPSYAGKIAGRLRRMHREWREREFDLLNRQFAVTHRWDDEASKAILGCEDGNALIQRVLREAEAEERRAAA